MIEYEARRHYRDAAVAERYEEQFRSPRTLHDWRARIFGGFEERAFRAMLERLPRGGAVLDVACGTGRYTRCLLAEGFQVTGTDVSPEMLARAVRTTGRHPRLRAFQVGDAARLPFEDGEFDGITCMRLYHRIPPATRGRMLREIRRVGRGWAILFFGMTNPWLAIRRSLRRLGGGRPSDPYPITMRDLESELDAAGLRMLEQRWVLPGLADGMVVRVGWRATRPQVDGTSPHAISRPPRAEALDARDPRNDEAPRERVARGGRPGR